MQFLEFYDKLGTVLFKYGESMDSVAYHIDQDLDTIGKRCIDAINARWNFGTRSDQRPRFSLLTDPSREISHFESNRNSVCLSITHILEYPGIVFGEEIGHWLRCKLCPETSELTTQEFFGYLGRDLLYQSLKLDRYSDLFNLFVQRQNRPRKAKSKVMNELRQLREKFNSVEIDSEEYRLQRLRLISHAQGYYFARKVNFDRVTNWPLLYRLSDHEVRMRFFRSNPRY